MKKVNNSYENNPKEYESLLRKNLSGDHHTKVSLIDFAVRVAIEAELKEIELKKYKVLAVEKIQSENLTIQLLKNTKTWDLGQIASVLENDFGFIDIANLLRNAKKKAYKQNENNAKSARKAKPSYQCVENYKNKWISDYLKKHGVNRESGWRGLCAKHFNISYRTLKTIYP